MTELALKYGLGFADLYDRDGLIRLDRAFVAHLAAGDPGLHERLMAARAAPEALAHKDESDLIVDLAPHVEDFVGGLFGIKAEMRAMQAGHDRLAPLFSVKRLFVQRRAVKEIKEDAAAQLDGGALVAEIEGRIGSGDENMAGLISDLPNDPAHDSNTSYQNLYQIRLWTANGAGSWLVGMRSASASFVRAMRSVGSSMAALPNSPSLRSSRRLSSMDPPWNSMNWTGSDQDS